MMRRAGFSRAEFAKLQEARANSDALVQLEAEAMAAVHGRFKDDAGTFTREAKPDLEMARALTHGDAYHTAKAKIMAPINEFFTLLGPSGCGKTTLLTLGRPTRVGRSSSRSPLWLSRSPP